MYHLDALPLPRPDTWSSDNPHCRVHYQVQAEAEPDLLCRLLNLFALQLLTPLQVQARQHDGRFLIELELDGLSWHRAQVIGEKMRNLISVFSVQLQSSAHAQPQALQAAG
ncbi:hypothetical protein NLK61_14980 [Pseudomonas fuscovaginae UPB0736]|uniref:hypothetical protein n=1 Tax=Pseudomonas asplenii TaxID=53407 RepID=UPI0002892778|nr:MULTISPECIES: hypothetical protein [Pseudomonas]UUQ62604.1 hypothetical protein NLK61_14980 [Pseudomonas fuscovaginae UPB0736]UZE28889.1 hypothetical protein LOY63_26900 [Pseudomonas asplenii]